MPFWKNDGGRPEGTEELESGAVIHYTCNAPGEEVLESAGIQPVGSRFGVDNREVVVIPGEHFDSKGLSKGTVEAEKILRDLDN